jgi:hypothetical protein
MQFSRRRSCIAIVHIPMGSGVSRSKSVLVPRQGIILPSPLPPHHPTVPLTQEPATVHVAPASPAKDPAAAVAPSALPVETLSPLGLTLSGLRALFKLCDAAVPCDGLSCSQVLLRAVPVVCPAQAAQCRCILFHCAFMQLCADDSLPLQLLRLACAERPRQLLPPCKPVSHLRAQVREQRCRACAIDCAHFCRTTVFALNGS